MKIIENPPREALHELQDALREEGLVKPADIWVFFNPFYFAAEDQGKIVGVAAISLNGELPELHKIYVRPNYRKQGVAKMLFDEMVRRFRDDGIQLFWVELVTEAGFEWLRSVSHDLTVEEEHANRYILRIG